MMYSPIVLFVYNRPYQTNEVLTSLSKCMYADESELYIFSDEAKKEAAKENVDKVRSIINDEKWTKMFKQVHVVEAESNKGLAKSVISGVTSVIKEHSRVIVVEDDNRVACDFLDYMNRALDFYKDNKKIGFIGAYKVPIDIPEDYKHDVFVMGRGSSYSWATWEDRWDLVDWEVKDYEQFRNDKKMRKAFNEYGSDRAAMLDSQMTNPNFNSWAIRFGYAMFKNNMLAVLPVKTRVENTGFDGSGVHNVASDRRFDVKIEDNLKPVVFEDVEIDDRIKKAFVKMFDASLLVRTKRVLKKILNK